MPVSLAYDLDDIDLHVWIRRSQLEEPRLLRVCFVVRAEVLTMVYGKLVQIC